MTDPNLALAQTVDILEPGDILGGRADLHRRLRIPLKQARALIPFLETIGVLRRTRYNKLMRTGVPFPELGDFRHAPTHVYRIKWGREGRRKVRYSKVQAGRLDAKLAKLAEYDDVLIYEVAEAWQTLWSPANGELRRRGIDRYQSPS